MPPSAANLGKVGQTSSSRSQGQKSRSQMKGLFIRNLHVKYESLTTYGSRDISNVKVFEKKVKLLGQGHKVKIQGLK